MHIKAVRKVEVADEGATLCDFFLSSFKSGLDRNQAKLGKATATE